MCPRTCSNRPGARPTRIGVDVRKRAIHAVPVARPLGELIAGPSREPALGPLLSALGPVVYAIRTRDGLVKIGWTANLGQRYSSLGHVSDILGWQSGTFEDEQEIHHSLVGLAVRGVEYYSPTEPRVLAIVNTMRSSLGIAALDAAA